MEIYLGLGSNLGDREEKLRGALKSLEERGIDIRRCASLYMTEPRDFEEQPWFLNTVIEVRTLLEPEVLMEHCLDVEKGAGRIREKPNGPRSLDIDIILYRDRALELPGLTIPHERFRERKFVLVPMVELSPDLADPVCGLTMRQLLDLCQDKGEVRAYRGPLL